MYQIENILFIFPMLCIAFSLGKQTKKKAFILFVVLIILIPFSNIGSDYLAYKDQYKMIKEGIELKNIHGEILFKELMKIFVDMGLNYIAFRVIFLTILYGILFMILYKESENISYSFFILYSTYLIYLCSAYRQFIVMVLILLSFYLFKKNKVKLTILILVASLFFHISSIIALIYFLYLLVKKGQSTIKISKILISLGLTVIFTMLLRIFQNWIILIASILNRKDQLMYYLDFNRTLLTIGFLSRIFILIILIILRKTIRKDKMQIWLFNFYFFGVLIYILIPSELMAGRFSNNARIVEIILLPYIIFRGSLHEKILKVIILSSYVLVILYYQLKMQGGYYPYINILF